MAVILRDVNWGGLAISGFNNILKKYSVNPNTLSPYGVKPLSDHAFPQSSAYLLCTLYFEGFV